jgi:phosphomannomutase
MPLIKSISGARGTIGGTLGQSLTPFDIVTITSSFVHNIIKNKPEKIIIARDARPSGMIIKNIVTATIQSMGVNVEDLGLSTTPTLALAIKNKKASGGIMISASHNPGKWNALKLFNSNGEYIDHECAKKIFQGTDLTSIKFATTNYIGTYTSVDDHISKHIEEIKLLPIIEVDKIKKRKLKAAVDVINSSGSIAIPKLLEALGVEIVKIINNDITGVFNHDPEPIPENLNELANCVKQYKCDIGIAVDPDVDRLSLIDENGVPLGEEYTLIAAADYVLQTEGGDTVSNISSSGILKHLTEQYNFIHYEAAVGELNVVNMMKQTKAPIGGEGNGGVIYAKLHYGRDALIGIALILSYLARTNLTLSQIKAKYKQLYLKKEVVEVDHNYNFQKLFSSLEDIYREQKINKIDGLKIYFDQDWVHVRISNTEMCIRIHAESTSLKKANSLINLIKKQI